MLHRPPSERDLARLYWELAQLGAPATGAKLRWRYAPRSREELTCLAAEMVRYDARLLTILVSWLLATWDTQNPLGLRRAMTPMRWPQALCVVLDFVRDASADAELRRYLAYVTAGWPAVTPVERFFFDAERPQARRAARQLGQSLREYSRWGFVGTERPQVDVFRKRSVGRYDQRTRLDTLRRLAQLRGEITLSDYLSEIDHAVSRQQAVLDARRAGLRPRGKKRGTRWALPVREQGSLAPWPRPRQ